MKIVNNLFKYISAIATVVVFLAPSVFGQSSTNKEFGGAAVIIELTDNDIELQVFVDGVDWRTVNLSNPYGQNIFSTKGKKKLKRQGGMSEMFWASEPTHYLENVDNDGTIEEFLRRFPEGKYTFRGMTVNRETIEGEAFLTHNLAAIPTIIKPDPESSNEVLSKHEVVIEWEPVKKSFFSGKPNVEIVEYQVIIDEDLDRQHGTWVDGSTRRALINLPPNVTKFKVPPTMLLEGVLYNVEVLAIEKSGNSSIATSQFQVASMCM